MTVVNIHILKSVLVLFNQELVKHCLLEVHTLNVKQGHHAVEISLEAHLVISISALVIDVNLLMNDILRSSHFSQKVKSDIFET